MIIATDFKGFAEDVTKRHLIERTISDHKLAVRTGEYIYISIDHSNKTHYLYVNLFLIHNNEPSIYTHMIL